MGVSLVSSYPEINLCLHHIIDATQTSVNKFQPAFESICSLPPSLHFLEPLTFIFLSPCEFSKQPLTPTSLFWLIKAKTHSTISDPRNLSAGRRLQFKSCSEHKNTAVFHLTSFSAIYANVYIALWLSFLTSLQPNTGNYYSGIKWHEHIQSNKCAGIRSVLSKLSAKILWWKQHFIYHQKHIPLKTPVLGLADGQPSKLWQSTGKRDYQFTRTINLERPVFKPLTNYLRKGTKFLK